MKALSVMVFILLTVCSVSAEIDKQYDPLNSSSSVASIFHSNVAPWDTVRFFNISRGKGEVWSSIMFFSSEPGIWFFSQSDMDMIIDDIHYIVKFGTAKSSLDKETHKLTQMAAYLIEPSMREKFMNAKKLIVRVYFNNKPDIAWTVPGFVLDEWKQVIRNK
jgi:hypothetical protein